MKYQSKKKKILFVIQSLRMGGAERVQVTVANALVNIGYDITILTWEPMQEFLSDLDERVHYIYKPTDQHLGNRIPYIRHKFYDDGMWLERASSRQINRYYTGREKYDVEIAFFHSLALDIVSGAPKNMLKIAWIHHDLSQLDDARPAQWEKYKQLYHEIRNIVCVSESSRQSFINAIGDTGSIRVIYNMLPEKEILRKAEEKPRQTVNKAQFHLVMVGRYKTAKGYKRLIESVFRLHEEGKDISLALVGEGDEKDRIQALIGELHAENYISTVNGRNNPYPYIKEADLLVCSSFTEGYNLTVAEALLLGVPVLSTDCAGPNEILDNGKYGMIVENSEKGLYDGIRQLYDSPALLKEYREKTVERREFFNEDKILAQITALFEG